jgi:uncharacterized RmlC-like cupin family protein
MKQETAGFSNPAVGWSRQFLWRKMENEIGTMNKTNSNFLPLPKVTCRVVGPGAEFVGKQGLSYAPGISAESVGAHAIHLQVVTIPACGRAKAHRHDGHETGIYILSGESGMWYGERLEEHLSAKSGDFVYIPANMPHLPYNLSDTENCVAIITRTDPNEQESVVLLPELDRIHPSL